MERVCLDFWLPKWTFKEWVLPAGGGGREALCWKTSSVSSAFCLDRTERGRLIQDLSSCSGSDDDTRKVKNRISGSAKVHRQTWKGVPLRNGVSYHQVILTQALFPVTCAPRWDQQLPQPFPGNSTAAPGLMGGISSSCTITLAPQRAKECLKGLW